MNSPNLDSFLTLPKPVKFVMALLTGATVTSLAYIVDYRFAVIIALGMGMLAAVLTGYRRFLKWTDSRKSQTLAGSIAQHGAAAPNALSNPNSRAKLDAMKRSFEVGMEKFATAGKDVYSMPWYVVVGEPGAGKTEAIRHCNVGFPPGLQDEMQGVGGTINMNWWFTNRAVLLDTAGRLMFEEVAPGETHEWPEFLKLLRRNRPNCPINGLLLVIPCDSLVKDSEADIGRKAGKIAQQLDVIQRTLDVRFPVFVLITKSDLLDGFREFFDDMDPDSQHQMLGWSNPLPRDVAFDPALVDQHIQTVVARIRKRRLGLLKDPIPQHGSARRTDEVDALYSLPESFALAAPRLRSYLEKVFVAGPWSAKPLFLRGIYFTSAMREGAALDLVLAQAIGVSVDALPEGRAWERERAYFLRDLFTEKIFPEAGLVTRATNTKKLIRSRQIALYGAGFGAMALLLLFSFLSYRQFQSSIGEQSKIWNYARQGWKNGEWHPLVSPTTAGANDPAARQQYNADAPLDPASGAATLTAFHRRLREISATDIPIGLVFRPLAKFFHLEGDRKRAQRVVFEGSVVKPPLVAARERLLAAPATPGKTAGDNTLRQAELVAALIRLEADAVAKKGAETAAGGIVKPSVLYASATGPDALEKGFSSLSDDFVWTYTKNPAGKWPPAWLALGSTSLEANKPIRAGLDRLFTEAAGSFAGAETNLKLVKGLRDDLREFRAREGRLNDLAKTDERTDLDNKMRGRLDELKVTKASIDTRIKAARNGGLLKEYSLSKDYLDLVDQSKTQGDDAFKIVRDAAANAGAGPDAKLFPEVVAALDRKHDELVARISNSFNKSEVAELAELDDLLKDFGDGRRFYEVRAKQYVDAEAEGSKADGGGSLLGRDWNLLAELRERIDKVRGDSKTTQEKLGGKFDACAYFYDRAYEKRRDSIAARYLAETRNSFNNGFSFPLVKGDNRRMTKQQLAEARTLLALWAKDLKSDNLKLVPSGTAQKLKAFGADIEKLAATADGVEANITINLVNYGESPDKSGLDRLRKIVLDGGERDTSTSNDIEVGTGSIFNTYRMTFLDYTTGTQESYPLTIDGYELATRVHGNGKVKVTVPRIGLPVFLAVKADRPIPDMNSLPAKQKILADLN